MASYCTATDVGTMLQLTFAVDSKPTDTVVTDLCSVITSEINYTLMSQSIVPPTSGDLFNICRVRCMYGVAALVGVASLGNVEDVSGSQGVDYRKEYKAFIQDIKDNADYYRSIPRVFVLGNPLLDGIITDDDLDTMMLPNEWVD